MKCACPDTARKRYRWTVAVQTPSGTPDAAGQVDTTVDANWSALGNIRVNFITKGSREWHLHDQTQAEVTHIIETPSTALSRSVGPTDRIVFDSRKFNVTGAYDVDEARRVVRFEVTEAT